LFLAAVSAPSRLDRLIVIGRPPRLFRAGNDDQRQDGSMQRIARLSPSSRLVVVALAALVAIVGIGPALQPTTAAAVSRWTGGVDLYRSGVFTTQQTWLWCTAADVQIIRNIADHAADHSRSSQQRYFDYMRAHNRYDIPLKDGVDPAGWTAGLRHFVDGRYRLVASRSFDAAMRSAVTNLRKTNLPVAITVSHGNHAWVLTGFTATADPAVTSRFTVTSVRVVGPLWGLQSRSYGYDMRPDTKLTPSQLRGFFTPWHYTSVPMAWENLWVSVQPVAAQTTTSAPKATPRPSPKAIPRPSPTATATVTATATATATATSTSSPSHGAIAAYANPAPSGGTDPATAQARTENRDGFWLLASIAASVSIALAIAIALASRRRSGGLQAIKPPIERPPA
jgi:hypothetical protein